MNKPSATKEVYWRWKVHGDDYPQAWSHARVEHLKAADLIKLHDTTCPSAMAIACVGDIDWRYA